LLDLARAQMAWPMDQLSARSGFSFWVVKIKLVKNNSQMVKRDKVIKILYGILLNIK
jgi:hypothetical protein